MQRKNNKDGNPVNDRKSKRYQRKSVFDVPFNRVDSAIAKEKEIFFDSYAASIFMTPRTSFREFLQKQIINRNAKIWWACRDALDETMKQLSFQWKLKMMDPRFDTRHFREMRDQILKEISEVHDYMHAIITNEEDAQQALFQEESRIFAQRKPNLISYSKAVKQAILDIEMLLNVKEMTSIQSHEINSHLNVIKKNLNAIKDFLKANGHSSTMKVAISGAEEISELVTQVEKEMKNNFDPARIRHSIVAINAFIETLNELLFEAKPLNVVGIPPHITNDSEDKVILFKLREQLVLDIKKSIETCNDAYMRNFQKTKTPPKGSPKP